MKTCNEHSNEHEIYGEWDVILGGCEPPKCTLTDPNLTSSPTGNDCTNVPAAIDSTCEIKCATDYALGKVKVRTNKHKLTCRGTTNADIGWMQTIKTTFVPPVCTRKKCEKIRSPPSGYQSIMSNKGTDCVKFGVPTKEICTLTCQGGKTISGDSTITCNEHSNEHEIYGDWQGTLGTCV